MVSIQVAKIAANAVKNSGRIVYSTRNKHNAAGTMFDALCNTMTKTNVSKQSADGIIKNIKSIEKDLYEDAHELLARSGADAQISCRIKSRESMGVKIQKKFNKMLNKTYEENRKDLQQIIKEGTISIPGDSFGIRFTLNSETNGNKRNADLIYKELVKTHEKPGSNLKLSEFEDYFGKGTTPYGSTESANLFSDLRYKTLSGKTKRTKVVLEPKDTGYTRSNISGYLRGKPTEIQIGGKYTVQWGNVEHIFHDVRQGKPLNIKGMTPEQKKLAQSIRKEYDNLLKNKTLHDTYMNEYLVKIWEVLREAELKNLSNPVFPSLPKGISKLLSAENVLKLEVKHNV